MEIAIPQIMKFYDILVTIGGLYSSDGWLSQVEIEVSGEIVKPFVQDLRFHITNLYFTKYLKYIQETDQTNQFVDYVNLFLLCKFFSIINVEIPDFTSLKMVDFCQNEERGDENSFVQRIVTKMKRRNEILADILIMKETSHLQTISSPNDRVKNARSLIQERELKIENMILPFRYYFGELLHLSTDNTKKEILSEKIIRPAIYLHCVSNNCPNLFEIMNSQIPEFRSECVECKFKENILSYAYCMEHREKVHHFRKCEVHENEKVMRELRAEKIRREGPYQTAFDEVFERRQIQREDKKF